MPAAAAGWAFTAIIAAGAAPATAAAVAAVASAVVSGAIAGAVVGAATSLMTGQNVLKGALKGAAIGGVTAGVLKGIGIAAGGGLTVTNTSGTAGSAVGESTVGQVGTAGEAAAAETATEASTTASRAPDVVSAAAEPTVGSEVMNTVPSTPIPETVKPGFLSGMSDNSAKLLSGVGQGMAQGAGEFLSAREKADADKQLTEYQRSNLLADREANTPGEFKAQTANIQVPDWWQRHLDPSQNFAYSTGAQNAKKIQ